MPVVLTTVMASFSEGYSELFYDIIGTTNKAGTKINDSAPTILFVL